MSLFVLPLASLAVLTFATRGAGVDTPISLTDDSVAPVSAAGELVADLVHDAAAAARPARVELSAPPAPAFATTLDDAPTPLEPVSAPQRMPEGMLLDAEADDDAFAAHYAGLPMDGLVRQLHRVERLVRVLAEPLSAPLDLHLEGYDKPTLDREYAWLGAAVSAYMYPEDTGQRVPTPLPTIEVERRNRGAEREQLRVLQTRLTRRYSLLMRRAMDVLHAEGSYTSSIHDKQSFAVG